MPPITATTKLAPVIGDPVRHSLSPVIHNAAFQALDLDWTYVAFEVPDGRAGAALAAMRALGIDGLSVTMPHKAAVAASVDDLTPTAAALGVANTVVRTADDRLLADNTDGPGFVDSLAQLDFDPAGHRCVVLGAGGAARAVVHALAAAGAGEVAVANRTAEKATSVAALAGVKGSVVSLGAVGEFDLIVNATSVGMYGAGASGQTPCEVDRLRAGQLVADLVYEPEDTPLVVAARERGLAVLSGVGMLVHQGARQFELWTGEPAPVATMAAAARQALTERRQGV